jgi:hypothetical protein
LGHV